MNILFLMYPWERVDPDNDSTIRMIHECVSRKHTVALATVHNLTMCINKLNRVKLQTKIIDFIENIIDTKKHIHARKSEFTKAIEDA